MNTSLIEYGISLKLHFKSRNIKCSKTLSSPIKNIGANLHKVKLQESPNNAAEIYVEQSLLNSLQKNLENTLVAQTWILLV